jgi:hypothetical protein
MILDFRIQILDLSSISNRDGIERLEYKDSHGNNFDLNDRQVLDLLQSYNFSIRHACAPVA